MSTRVAADRMCGYCKQAVYSHNGSQAGHTELITLSSGQTGRQLWHRRRCWPAEQRRRRELERAVRQQQRADALTTGDAMALEVVRRGPMVVERAEPVLPAETVEGAELGPTPPAGELRPTVKGGKGGAHRGLQATMHRLIAETYGAGGAMAGHWFHASDCARLLVQAGMTTTVGTVKTLIWTFGQQHPLERLRIGNSRYSRVAGLPLPAGQAAPEQAPVTTTKLVTTTAPKQAAPAARQATQELLAAVDRACADLSMLMGELVAETRQQLRRQIEGRLG